MVYKRYCGCMYKPYTFNILKCFLGCEIHKDDESKISHTTDKTWSSFKDNYKLVKKYKRAIYGV